MHVTGRVNKRLTGRSVTLEKQCYFNNHCLHKECLKISDIPSIVKSKSFEATVLNIFHSIDVPSDLSHASYTLLKFYHKGHN